jgi:hypothetical protein
MPKKEIEPDLVSESDYDGEPLDQVIRSCIKDFQEALNNIQQGLLTMIDHDEITVEEYGPVWELANDLIALSKEMKDIIKSFKPNGFKLGLRMENLEGLQ